MWQKLMVFWLIGLGLMACKKSAEPTLSELRGQVLSQAEWQGDLAKVNTEVQPAVVLTLAGIDPEMLNFDLPLTNIRVNFKNDGTWSGKDANGESLEGTWALLEDGQKIKISGFQIELLREELPEDLLAILPEDFDLSLPDTYEIMELNDQKFTIQTATSRQLPIGLPTGGSINLTISPKVEIFLKK
ncbi:MAG: hypothetical protein MUE85_13240 [Microscillaceae bacterium]|jgi:hypothetical protein|nr:hypothetical protein [Microscillaceae bacterium]